MESVSKVFIKNPKFDKYLFVLRDNSQSVVNPNTWSLVGGRIKSNETPENALKREVKEESNINLNNIKFIRKEICTMVYKQKHMKSNVYFFIADTDADLRQIKLTEGQKVAYYSLNKLLKLNVGNWLRHFIRKNRDLIKDGVKEVAKR